jgi:hypothetical protein
MTSLACSAPGCKCRAIWTLIPGYVTARGKYLCQSHWRELSSASSIESECYKPLNGPAGENRHRAAAQSVG